VVRHGGIPETSFWPYIWQRWGASVTEVEDLAAETAAHPFYDDFWRSKSADLEKITVPAFVVASWSDHGLHSRGTLEGFRRRAAKSSGSTSRSCRRAPGSRQASGCCSWSRARM
jgi:hypothetical protein